MNKLYVIRIIHQPSGIVLSTFNYWNEADAINKMRMYIPDWSFEVIENNDIHKIWEGR